MILNNFRIPKDCLLDRLCKIEEDGTYSSPMKKNDRFAATMVSLSGGRILVAKASNV
jgi:hypothetical protein